MKLIVEATFFKFQFITGIERHFFLLLRILDSIDLFREIIIVTSCPIPSHLIKGYRVAIRSIVIDRNTEENWEKVYRDNEFDLLYSTFELPIALPNDDIPVVYVLHDPGRYLFPKLMESEVIKQHKDILSKSLERKNLSIVTVSYSSRDDILSLMPEMVDKVYVIHNYVDQNILDSSELSGNDLGGLTVGKFFLTVGRYIPTKNTLSLVKAFCRRSSAFEEYQLVIVGRGGWYKSLDQFLAKSQPHNVISVDVVEELELIWLYKNSYALVSASIYEGFGMPLIEAGVLGCPRICCSDIPVYREIFPFASCFFDPYDEDSILRQVFTTPIGSDSFKHRIEGEYTLEKSRLQFVNMFHSVMVHVERNTSRK